MYKYCNNQNKYEILTLLAAWINLENIILSKIQPVPTEQIMYIPSKPTVVNSQTHLTKVIVVDSDWGRGKWGCRVGWVQSFHLEE